MIIIDTKPLINRKIIRRICSYHIDMVLNGYLASLKDRVRIQARAKIRARRKVRVRVRLRLWQRLG